MSDTNLLSEGVYLMVFGMGFVYLFLIILVYTVKLMSFLVIRFSPEPVPVSIPATESFPAPSELPPEQLRAVLAAAVHHHRRTHVQSCSGSTTGDKK